MTKQQDRDELRDLLFGWSIGIGYYQSMVGLSEAGEMADSILSSDWLATRLAQARAGSLRHVAAELVHGADPETDPRVFDPWDVAALLESEAHRLKREAGVGDE